MCVCVCLCVFVCACVCVCSLLILYITAVLVVALVFGTNFADGVTFVCFETTSSVFIKDLL